MLWRRVINRMKIPQTHRTILICVSVAWFLCVLTLSQPCAAQKVASTVTEMASTQTVKLMGQVVDRSGAPVANARVLLIDLNTLEIQRTSSDDRGSFEFNGLSRTPYEVKAACPNFVTGSAKVFELVDSVGFIDPNPPPFLTVNVKITISVKSAS